MEYQDKSPIKTKTITIDGQSCVGKTTLAKSIHWETHSFYLSTGIVWKAFVLYHIKLKKDSIYDTLLELKSRGEKPFQFYCVGSGTIRCGLLDYAYQLNKYKKFDKREVEESMLKIKQSGKIRNFVNKEIKDFFKWIFNNYYSEFFILDGRDCGSNIFPKADFKFFIYGSLEERIKKLIKRGDKKSHTEAKIFLINSDRSDEDNLKISYDQKKIRSDFKTTYQIKNRVMDVIRDKKKVPGF